MNAKRKGISAAAFGTQSFHNHAEAPKAPAKPQSRMEPVDRWNPATKRFDTVMIERKEVK